MGFESNLSFSFSALKSRDSLAWALAYFLVHGAMLVGIFVLILALFTPIFPAILGALSDVGANGVLSEEKAMLLVRLAADYVAQNPLSLGVFFVGVVFLLLVAFLVSVWIELHLFSSALTKKEMEKALKPISAGLVGDAIVGGVVAFFRSAFWPFAGRFRLVVWVSWLFMIAGFLLVLAGIVVQPVFLLVGVPAWVLGFCVWVVCLIYGQLRFMFFRVFLMQSASPGYGQALLDSWVFSRSKMASIVGQLIVCSIVLYLLIFLLGLFFGVFYWVLQVLGLSAITFVLNQLYHLGINALAVLVSVFFTVGLYFELRAQVPTKA